MARLQAWTARGNALFSITPQSVNAIENYVRWAEFEAPRNIAIQMDKLVQQMALMNQSFARKMSFGPYDPGEMHPEQAWRTPSQGIRRISQNYYIGWRVKKIRTGHYLLYNASREAYFIEYGIAMVGFGERHVPARRIRRPVRKLSLLKTLEFMKTTQAYHRIWVDMFKSRHAHGGFTQIIQSPAGGHSIWVPASEHEARGVIRSMVRRGHGSSYRDRVRLSPSGWQIRKGNPGGGSYTGPMLGRRLP